MSLNINSNKYVFTFATIICLVCAVLLSFFTEALREKQELNAEIEVKKNILKAVKLKDPITAKNTPDEIKKIFNDRIEEAVIDDQGNIVSDRKPHDIKESEKNLLPLYIYKEDNAVVSYAFPVTGQGLWSTLYGYLALEADGVVVRGITFYKHGETPGLGAEIEKDWFQDNFKGKKVWSVKDNKLTPIIIAKGKAEGQYSKEEMDYHVDGITAATLTGQGVTDLIAKWLKIYEPYFSKLRKI